MDNIKTIAKYFAGPVSDPKKNSYKVTKKLNCPILLYPVNIKAIRFQLSMHIPKLDYKKEILV